MSKNGNGVIDAVIWAVCGSDGLFGYVRPQDDTTKPLVPFIGVEGLRQAVEECACTAYTVTYAARCGVRTFDWVESGAYTLDPIIPAILGLLEAPWEEYAQVWLDKVPEGSKNLAVLLALKGIAAGAPMAVEDGGIWAICCGIGVGGPEDAVALMRRHGYL
jgi:hypothetical protein